jgi:tetratricopeptide (TPR) repeat protein
MERQGRCTQSGENYQDALIASDHTLVIDSQFVKGLLNRRCILNNLGKYEDKLKAYEITIGIDPKSTDPWFKRGYALAAMGRYDQAIRAFAWEAEFDSICPNRKIKCRLVETNRDLVTTFLVKYAAWIIISLLIMGGLEGIYIKRKKK